jgi:hypothetical protein
VRRHHLDRLDRVGPQQRLPEDRGPHHDRLRGRARRIAVERLIEIVGPGARVMTSPGWAAPTAEISCAVVATGTTAARAGPGAPRRPQSSAQSATMDRYGGSNSGSHERCRYCYSSMR